MKPPISPFRPAATVLALIAALLGLALGNPLPAQTKPAAPAPKPAAPASVAPVGNPPAAKPELRPDPPENVLFRPFFLTPDIAHYAGLAFRIRHEASGQHYLVTAHSIFSPAYGLDVQMTSADIAKVIVAAVGVSCTDRNKIVVAQPYVLIPDAKPADDKGNSEKDIALFRIAAREGEPSLLLDPAPPLQGDRVWLFVKYPDSPRLGLEPATMAFVSPKEIRYLLDNKLADLKGTVGAPLLDKDGYVVGIHLGTYTAPSGRVYGFACPAAAVAPYIEPARKAKSLLK